MSVLVIHHIIPGMGINNQHTTRGTKNDFCFHRHHPNLNLRPRPRHRLKLQRPMDGHKKSSEAIASKTLNVFAGGQIE